MDEYFEMAVAETRRGIEAGVSGPFGATIVRGVDVVAAVGNRQLGDRDQMVAVREACRRLGTMDLSDCTMYATCEPCPMCVGVMIWAGIKDVYYAATRHDAARYGFSDMHLRRFFAGGDATVINLVPIERRDDCIALFTDFHDKHPGLVALP